VAGYAEILSPIVKEYSSDIGSGSLKQPCSAMRVRLLCEYRRAFLAMRRSASIYEGANGSRPWTSSAGAGYKRVLFQNC
jgi:hypothetical protein